MQARIDACDLGHLKLAESRLPSTLFMHITFGRRRSNEVRVVVGQIRIEKDQGIFQKRPVLHCIA
jgi:hypothetical protein